MDEPKSGYEFLQELRRRQGKERPTYNDFASYLEQKARRTATPLTGQFELTPLCNFDCKMCYVHLAKEQMKGRQVLTAARWKDLMRQAADAGMLNAVLTGGECLTYPGFEELYLYLQSLGCSVSVLTNGFLLDEEMVRFFCQNRPEEIQVTLYGGCEEDYERVTGRRAFHTVCENTRRAVEADLPVLISLTPSRFLGEGVLDAVRAAYAITRNVKVNISIFDPREDTDRAGQQGETDLELYVRALTLLEELDGRGVPPIPEDRMPPAGGPYQTWDACGPQCGAGRSTFSVTWQGKMIPCNRLGMIETDPLRDGFLPAWRELNERSMRLPRVAACRECPYEEACPRCAGDLLRFADSGNRPIWLCQRAIAFVRHGIWHVPGCE